MVNWDLTTPLRDTALYRLAVCQTGQKFLVEIFSAMQLKLTAHYGLGVLIARVRLA
jgi:hypothetical protein